MSTILFLVWGFWILRIIANILAFSQLWYIKEYRFDRMFIHLGTTSGRRILFTPWRRPRISPKSIALISVSALLLAVFYQQLPWTPLFRLIAVDLLSFPVTGFVVFVLKIPTFAYHEWQIRRAIQKLRDHKPMKVIGITGSYGKTSTKEFLVSLLSTKFTVLKTQSSKNSPIGIAETILEGLREEHEVFIAEMGAYKTGEIARMADMVRPEIGIVTAINPQHQDLFRSIENTVRAKYELIDGLVGSNIAIFNQDDSRTRQMAVRAASEGKHVVVYSRKTAKSDFDDFFIAKEVVFERSRVRFVVYHKKQRKAISIPLLGVHQISNVMAAVAGAVACGMTFSDACQAAHSIKPFDRTMQPVDGINGSLFVNDTFNNNPDAAKAAVDYLASSGGKKILVFQPMIELGEYADISHEDFGTYAAKTCDMIFLTNDNHIDAIRRGMKRTTEKNIIRVGTLQEVSEYIRKNVRSGDTVLFKGKEAERFLTDLTR